MEQMTITVKGIELEVYYEYDPPERCIRYDGAGGTPPFAPEVTVYSVEMEGTDITPLVEEQMEVIREEVIDKLT